MWTKKRVTLAAATGLGLVAMLAGLFAARGGLAAASPAAKGPSTSPIHLTRVGSGSLSHTAGVVTGVSSTEIGIQPSVDQQLPKTATISHVSASGVPTPAGQAVVTDSSVNGFAGLNHFQQRYAGSGAYKNTNFSSEPPDQGLCVGNGFVVESINSAIRIYDTHGNALTASTPLNQFFNLAPSIIRSTPLVFGDFTSDPKCYYDSDTGRFFYTILQIDTDSATGNFLGHSHTELAVSQTSDPTQAWNLYSIDTTDDGSNGTPSHAGCPCFGDQPLIGADANGFYISNNEFSIAGSAFNGTQLYAFSKQGLETGTSTGGMLLDVGAMPTPDAGGVWGSVQPATSPNGVYATANNGTEYFVAGLDFSNTLDNRVAVFALSNTASLASASPSLDLASKVIGSEVYGFPPNAIQKNGPIPQADSAHNPAELIAGNDDRMNQVVFAGGKLWSGLNSVVKTPNGPTRVGIAYFVVAPSGSGSSFSASMASQGYVAVNNNNTLYPSIGVNAQGGAVMAFTVVGPDYYPSAAYYNLTGGDGAIHIAGAGAGPDDGFTGYKKVGGVRAPARWGDYSAAVAGPDGSIWLATEYINQSCSDAQYNADPTCGGTRTILANWATFVYNVKP